MLLLAHYARSAAINWITCVFSLNVVHSSKNNYAIHVYQFITVYNLLPVPVHWELTLDFFSEEPNDIKIH